MSEHRQQDRWTRVLNQAERSYPDAVGIALVEGLPPLARVAFVARTARRTQRYIRFEVALAGSVIEGSIRAAEKVAGGETLTVEEDRAANDKAVLRACELEKLQGSEAAAEGGGVARMTARCVYGPEIAYGEATLLADFELQRTVARYVELAENRVNDSEGAVKAESQALEADLRRLILFAEESGEEWLDPKLNGPIHAHNDRGWAAMLEDAGVPSNRQRTGNRERWVRIHEAVRGAGGCFYSQDVFGPV